MEPLIIAVCDDDTVFLERIKHQLQQVAFHLNTRIEVHLFSSASIFMQQIQGAYNPNILFLDVEMPDVDGFSIGHLVRRKCDKGVSLIYVSYLQDYAIHAFQVQPMDFLLKPISFLTLKHTLEKCLQRIGAQDTFRYIDQGITYDIPVAEIYYFESYLRHIKIHTKTASHTFRGTMKKTENDLPTGMFVRPHQSYLVNENFVKRRTYEALIMENDVVIPISQNRRRDIRAHFLKCMEHDSRGDNQC